MTLPGTAPARRVHVPPVPRGTLPDPGGTTPADQHYRKVQQAVGVYNGWRDSFPRGIDMDELKDNQGLFSGSDAALSMAEALQPVKNAAAAATAKVSELLKGSSRVEDEAAAGSLWHRKERLFDSITNGAKALAAIQNTIADASSAEVPVYSRELPDYLASRGLPGDWLPRALVSKIDGMPAATAEDTVAQRKLAVSEYNHGLAMKAFQTSTPVGALVDPAVVTPEPYANAAGE